MNIIIIGKDSEASGWAELYAAQPSTENVFITVIHEYAFSNLFNSKIKPAYHLYNKEKVINFVVDNGINIVISHDTRMNYGGVLDDLHDRGIDTFGAHKILAALEYDKLYFKSVCQETAVATPPVLWRGTVSILLNEMASLKYPFVIKETQYRGQVSICFSIDDVNKYIKSHRHNQNIFIEKFIPHQHQLDIQYALHNGSVNYIVSCEETKPHIYNDKITQYMSNVSSCVQPAPGISMDIINAHAMPLIEKIISHVIQGNKSYKGIFDMQFLVGNDGILYALEHNSRPGSPDMPAVWLLSENKTIHDDGWVLGIYTVIPKTRLFELSTNTLTGEDWYIHPDGLNQRRDKIVSNGMKPVIVSIKAKSYAELYDKADKILNSLFNKKWFFFDAYSGGTGKLLEKRSINSDAMPALSD